jgi:hypothetical protein
MESDMHLTICSLPTLPFPFFLKAETVKGCVIVIKFIQLSILPPTQSAQIPRKPVSLVLTPPVLIEDVFPFSLPLASVATMMDSSK